MRLLLTRAATDAARTRAALVASGHHVIVSPVIEMAATDAATPVGVIDALVATSAQTFAVPLDGVSFEARRLMPLFLVGSRTAEAARTADFAGAAIVSHNAAALAETFKRLSEPPRRLVYLAGRARKPELETAFAEMGHPLDVVEVYDAQRVDRLTAQAADAFARDDIDGVLHFSLRSAELFLANAERADIAVGRPIHFCMSDDVAGPLRNAGLPMIEVAATPTETDLLALVETRR